MDFFIIPFFTNLFKTLLLIGSNDMPSIKDIIGINTIEREPSSLSPLDIESQLIRFPLNNKTKVILVSKSPIRR